MTALDPKQWSDAGLARVLQAVKKEPGHTTGPWVAAKYEGFGPRTTVRQGDERRGMRIATTFEATSPKHIERNEANARLIAAAPTYYEGADAFLAYEAAVAEGDDVAAMLHYAEASRLLREAHAKATGEQR